MAKLNHLVKEALALLNQGEYTGAEALFRKRLNIQPADTKAMGLLALMACQSGYFLQAKSLLEKVLSLGDRDAAVYHHLAYALWQLEDWPGAEHALKCSMKINSSLPQSVRLQEMMQWERARRDALDQQSLHITAVISCYESADTIGQTLMSLVNQSRRPYEIIVTDDGSSEQVCDYIKKLLTVVEYHGILTRFLTHERTSPYRLNSVRNSAIREARGELIFITDGDTIVPKKILEQHSDIHARSVKPLFLACLRKDLHGDGSLRNLSKWWENFVINTENKRWEDIDLQAIFATATASYRKDVCQKVGAYNEAFNGAWGFDDTEFGFRMKTLAGARVTVSGTICHIPHETSLGSRDGTLNRRRYIESQLKVFKKTFIL